MAEPPPLETAYLVVCGAATASRAPELVAGLARRFASVVAVPTPNAARVLNPWDLERAGARVVESYFDAAIRPSPPPGAVLVAPCTFNSLNKLGHGIADSLALSITAEAIGRGMPVVVAVSANAALWAHPQARTSMAALRNWGCTVVEPGAEGERRTLAATDDILMALDVTLRTWRGHEEEPTEGFTRRPR